MAQGGVHRGKGDRRSVVLVGHSYVRRLGEYITKSPQLLNLGLEDVDVHCVGIGGVRVGPENQNCIWDAKHLNAVSKHHPFLIFLHLGENDLGHMPDGQISFQLLQLVDHLSTLSHSHTVIVGELVSFPRTRNQHLAAVQHINTHLSRAIQLPNIFWLHKSGITVGSPDLFLPDQVHLNDTGLHRYWRSVRTIVARVLNHSGQ